MVYSQTSTCPRKWHAQTPIGLWYTNGSPNLGPKTRPYNNQRKKQKIYKVVDFAVPADHRIKLKECEKGDKYLDLARELKTSMEHEGDNYTNCDWCFWHGNKGLLKGLEDLEVGGQVEKTARILRSVLETWGDLLSLNIQWKPISLRWCEKLYGNNNNTGGLCRFWYEGVYFFLSSGLGNKKSETQIMRAYANKTILTPLRAAQIVESKILTHLYRSRPKMICSDQIRKKLHCHYRRLYPNSSSFSKPWNSLALSSGHNVIHPLDSLELCFQFHFLFGSFL